MKGLRWNNGVTELSWVQGKPGDSLLWKFVYEITSNHDIQLSGIPAYNETIKSYAGGAAHARARVMGNITATTEFIDEECLLMIDGVACRL